jgi:hypothetical protein
LVGALLALYNAIASGNRALANRWAATTHAALAALEVATGPGDGLVAVRAALRSLASIQRGIGGEP